jgi:two-component system sensor histidine kinase/response regulator
MIKGNILVVDDTHASLKLLTELLTAEGYQVRPADSGELALVSTAAKAPDLILLDIRMAGMDGFEVLRNLKKQEKSCDIPIIFISSASEAEMRVEGLKLGAVDFISKPFQKDELLARIHIHMKLRQLTSQLERQAVELKRSNDQLQIEITERKRAEEQILQTNADLEQRVAERTAHLEAANKEIASVNYSIAHDLNIPVRAIDGFSQILMEEYHHQLDGEGQRLLGVIRQNTHKLDRLIKDMLALLRVSQNELKISPIDMTSLVQSVYLETASPEEQAQFTFSVSPLPETHGDPALMRLIWSNLISNAVKFTLPKEERTIRVGSQVMGGETIYSIQDSGVGFNPKYTPKIFGLFERLHKVDQFEGTGVGLAIVERAVQRLGGKVWAEGVIDQGATFYFTLGDA